MRSSDWLPIDTAPLNPYGQAYGPVILLWSATGNVPVAARYNCTGGPNNGPRWMTQHGDTIQPEDATHWMPIAAPWPGIKEDTDQ